MKRISKKPKKFLGPITVMFIILITIMIVTAIFSLLGFEGQKPIIVNGVLETSLVSVKNIFSVNGFKYIFNSVVTNFSLFEPLTIIIISLIGISIAEKSGLIKAIAQPLKKLKKLNLTFIVLLLSIIFVFLGEYSYTLLMPLVALIYKYLGKNPLLGIITVFMGLTIGYGAGMFYDYNDYLLGTMTELSARVDVDTEYTYSLLSTLYITIFSTCILSIIGANIIDKRIAPKFSKMEIEEEETHLSKKARFFTWITFVILLAILGIMVIPGPQYTGLLLDKSAGSYIAKLFGPNSPFKNSLPFLISLILMICSYVYGRFSKNIKTSIDYSEGLSKTFDKIGYLFVLMFFMSQIIGILEWTNFGTVLTTKLVDFMSALEFSGIPLIIVSFVIIIIVGILIPSTPAKWALFSPIMIPLFMRSNITPEYTQFVFTAADSISKALTPIFPYYILLLGLLYKFKDDNYQVTLFGTLKMILPTIMVLCGIWLLIIVGWYLVNIPLGVNSFPTL